jgi:transcriptional regulator with XRE-family HTH domain
LAKVEINRIKVALAETRRKNKWLAEQIGKDESTVSQWCTNARQPSLENLLRVANALEIDIRNLLYSTNNSEN